MITQSSKALARSPAALFDRARRLALAVLCLAPITLFAVALPYKVYEHFHNDGRTLSSPSVRP
ncbi:MAG: hypothetical protein ACHQK9_18190 [Reyranellales bacterium]